MENPEGARTRTVEASENGERLDTAVAALADVTRSAAARLIGDGAVTVNGQVHDKNYRLRAGDVLTDSAAAGAGGDRRGAGASAGRDI